jgi:hypothetical protein
MLPDSSCPRLTLSVSHNDFIGWCCYAKGDPPQLVWPQRRFALTAEASAFHFFQLGRGGFPCGGNFGKAVVNVK